jgi:predicted TIM-barrel fold metal-dependent hydrolase
MIIDCHAHVFQSWEGQCGHASSEIHRTYIQKVQTRTNADVIRVRDGARFSGALLFDPMDNTWAGLKDVNLRVGKNGRIDFTIDGDDYYSQYMPVGMQEIVAPPELMLQNMQIAGVDHTILQTGWGYGAMNDYNAFAQNQYPDKFTALLNVDEPRAYTPECVKEFDRAHQKLGLKGVYFALEPFARYGTDVRFDEDLYAEFWSKIDAAKLPVFFEPTAFPTYDAQGYIRNLTKLKTLMDRYRNIRWVLVMGPPVGFFGISGEWQFPDELQATYRHENLFIEVMFPISWGGKWDYPYPEAQALTKGMRDLFGASKLIWGSDAPNVERFCTYKQSLDYVRNYCSFLSASEKDAILGENIREVMSIPKPAAERA